MRCTLNSHAPTGPCSRRALCLLMALSPLAAVGSRAADEPADVTGTVLSLDGTCVASCPVVACRQDGQRSRSLTTDKNGEFRVPANWWEEPRYAGESYVCVGATQRDRARVVCDPLAWGTDGTREPLPPGPAPFEIKLLPLERTIVGRVLGPEGQPLAGIRVQTQQLVHPVLGNIHLYGYGMTQELPLPSTETDDAGRFQIRLPRVPGIRLELLHPKWVVRILKPADGDDLGDVVLEEAGRLPVRWSWEKLVFPFPASWSPPAV